MILFGPAPYAEYTDERMEKWITKVEKRLDAIENRIDLIEKSGAAKLSWQDIADGLAQQLDTVAENTRKESPEEYTG